MGLHYALPWQLYIAHMHVQGITVLTCERNGLTMYTCYKTFLQC
jgi:hypothetical protein